MTTLKEKMAKLREANRQKKMLQDRERDKLFYRWKWWLRKLNHKKAHQGLQERVRRIRQMRPLMTHDWAHEIAQKGF